MKCVYVDTDRTVREVIPQEATVPSVAHWYGAEFASHCVEAPDEVGQRWVYDPETRTFSPPILPDIPEISPEQQYKMLVQQYIREKYSDGDEFGLTNEATMGIMNSGTVSKEYTAYRNYVEECKKLAWQRVYEESRV